ncbi:methyltransferase [Candidatus Bathyarchaeota archaeon]|nr:MAG: methyltransferase [Candidatus Bathyarchaeota archaeon]TMI58487.1 MAG: methyltransferase [Candidatus Bathyarchaeota archaeon]
MVERTVSKRQLEIQLGKLKILQSPQLRLEQYPVSAKVAAELLHMAGFEHHDLQGKTIDLGTGTGRLAIGAATMGSKQVTGVDIDERSITLARENAIAAGVRVEWVVSDIKEVVGAYDTVIMNPPYGTRSSHADVQFLERAFELAPVSYSIHKSSTREFLRRVIERKNRRTDAVRSMSLDIPHLFPFHQKKWEKVDVDLYRIMS